MVPVAAAQDSRLAERDPAAVCFRAQAFRANGGPKVRAHTKVFGETAKSRKKRLVLDAQNLRPLFARQPDAGMFV